MGGAKSNTLREDPIYGHRHETVRRLITARPIVRPSDLARDPHYR